ncbi:MAG: hypothetical protein KGL39_29830 [Patescibacteria group bacterium]|nr:hypothetical protein [Patescibacteria group bacterium]
MYYSDHELATELAAQLNKTDLGVTSAVEYEAEMGFPNARHHTIVSLDNGQDFLLTVTRWGGPRADQ